MRFGLQASVRGSSLYEGEGNHGGGTNKSAVKAHRRSVYRQVACSFCFYLCTTFTEILYIV